MPIAITWAIIFHIDVLVMADGEQNHIESITFAFVCFILVLAQPVVEERLPSPGDGKMKVHEALKLPIQLVH